MKCYKCQSEENVKAGFIRGKQRYKCKSCGCFFSVEKKSDVKTVEQKNMALEMYHAGMGFRPIGRALGISYGTVFQWVKKQEENIQKLQRSCFLVDFKKTLPQFFIKKHYNKSHSFLIIF